MPTIKTIIIEYIIVLKIRSCILRTYKQHGLVTGFDNMLIYYIKTMTYIHAYLPTYLHTYTHTFAHTLSRTHTYMHAEVTYLHTFMHT